MSEKKTKTETPVIGLTKEFIEELKAANPKGVFKSTINGQDYVWRTLEREEYSQLANDQELDMLTKEEAITVICLLWPETSVDEIKKIAAGVPTTLAENIMSNSGFEATTVERL